ncbi:MAG: branched-chain amino acid ABC transporter ATP-binding protein/permease [Treponemataceae bacterium]
MRRAQTCASHRAIIIFPLFPFVDDYWIDVGFLVGIYVLLGLSLNIVLGEVGLFDLGHTAFYAIGAYCTAILNTRFDIPVLLLLPISALMAALFAWLATSPVIHLRGDYLCIVTIGIGEIVRLVAERDPFGLTRGANGITGIDPIIIGSFKFDTSTASYFFIWLALGLVVIALMRLQTSRQGRAWNYIREDEIAAGAMGVDVRSAKRLAFVLGAALAGVAGNLYAAKFQVISPTGFTFMESTLLFCIVLLGGLGSIPGTVIGATVVVVFPEIFRDAAQYRMLLFGAALAAMMIFKPAGMLPRRRSGLGLAGLGIKLSAEFLSRLENAQKPKNLKRQGRDHRLTEITAARAAAPGGEGPNDTENALLRVENLTLRFGGLSALENVSLSVKAGSITALIGPNGAGKTSLFNVISGIYKPTTGKVFFSGKNITGKKTHAIVRAGIARTFQNIRLFPLLSCLENVMCGPHVHASMGIWPAIFRLPSQRREEEQILGIAAWRLRQVGLWESRDELAKNLPYGKQRLLEIARALATSPELLVLDEPSSGLNDRESAELMDILKSIRTEGITILLIEHDMNVVMGISDEVVVLAEGELIASGSPTTIYNHPAVIEAYLGGDE